MKKWIDFNEISMDDELPTESLRKIDIEMRKKPKFDKTECDKEDEKSMIWKKNYT